MRKNCGQPSISASNCLLFEDFMHRRYKIYDYVVHISPRSKNESAENRFGSCIAGTSQKKLGNVAKIRYTC